MAVVGLKRSSPLAGSAAFRATSGVLDLALAGAACAPAGLSCFCSSRTTLTISQSERRRDIREIHGIVASHGNRAENGTRLPGPPSPRSTLLLAVVRSGLSDYRMYRTVVVESAGNHFPIIFPPHRRLSAQGLDQGTVVDSCWTLTSADLLESRCFYLELPLPQPQLLRFR